MLMNINCVQIDQYCRLQYMYMYTGVLHVYDLFGVVLICIACMCCMYIRYVYLTCVHMCMFCVCVCIHMVRCVHTYVGVHVCIF